MSILSFLQVIRGIPSQRAPRPARNRRLELETLERRSVLTVLDAALPLLEAMEAATSTMILESPPLVESPPPQAPLPAEAGSGGGTLEPEASEIPDPGAETLPTNGGSGGTGNPLPPPPGGPGPGTGHMAPHITSLASQGDDAWVYFTGTVTDSDGAVEGLIVYFMIGDQPQVAFTAVVQADGTFRSLEFVIAENTLISAYTVDTDGNHSTIATCYA